MCLSFLTVSPVEALTAAKPRFSVESQSPESAHLRGKKAGYLCFLSDPQITSGSFSPSWKRIPSRGLCLRSILTPLQHDSCNTYVWAVLATFSRSMNLPRTTQPRRKQFRDVSLGVFNCLEHLKRARGTEGKDCGYTEACRL